MAVSVNSVYKTVLSIMNKEQRGYLTPDEFNKIAKQVQLALIDKTFYDLNKQYNLKNSRMISAGDGDTSENIREKLDYLHKTSDISFTSNSATLPTDAYKILEIVSTDRLKVYEEIKRQELNYLLSSKLTAPSSLFPAFYKNTAGTTITGSPAVTDGVNVTVSYIKKPNDPRWGYTINQDYGNKVHDTSTYVATGIVEKDIVDSITTNTSDATASSEFLSVSPTTSGSGTGLVVDVTTNSSQEVDSIAVTSSGSGYVLGDTLTIPTSTIGGTTNVVVTLVSGDIYSSSTQGTTDFELHPSEETSIVTGILGYAGIVIRDANITNLAGTIIQANETAKQ